MKQLLIVSKKKVLCTHAEDEMKSYGGRGSENKGICNECSGW